MKTKRHPGKIILLFVCFGLPLLAAVKATVDNPAVYRGDPVTLTLSAEGEKIEFPPIGDIAGHPVSSRGTSRNLSIINGQTTRTIEQRLIFVPTKDVTIPAFDITVDGKTERTLPIKVKVLQPQAASAEAPIKLLMQAEKRDPYVGEAIRLDLTVRIKPGVRVDDLQIQEPTMEHFWIKSLGQQNGTRSVDGEGYITQTFSYLLFAQKSGPLTIPATFARIGTRQNRQQNAFGDPFFGSAFFGNRLQYKKIFSDDLTLQVKPLPDNLELYGTFTLNARVDQQKVQANKPVSLHIHIEGEGNVEDIRKFAPAMNHAVVYANDPEVKGFMRNGRYFGTFDQTIAIIPDRNVTIPAMTFRYFDKQTQQIVTKQTPPFAIEVVGGVVPVPEPATGTASRLRMSDQTAPSVPNTRSAGTAEAAALFAAGALSGAAALWLFGRWRRERTRAPERETPMAKKIKAAKDDRTLFELLLPYKGENEQIDRALHRLEANLYRQQKHRIDTRALINFFSGRQAESIELV